MRVVGILGGMGPQATVLLMSRIIAAVPATDDADHIPLIVHQTPQVPSRTRHLIQATGTDPGPALAAMARSLQAAGAEALAMPCNTAHAYAPAIRAAASLPFLDMRAATVAHLAGQGPRIGMLVSPAVRLAGVYDALFAAVGLQPVWAADDAPVLALIRRIKTGETGAAARAEFARLASTLATQSDHLLIACTELSLLSRALPDGFVTTDALDCLVDAIVAFSQHRGAAEI